EDKGPKIFESPKDLKKAGFYIKRYLEGHVMVVSHPTIKKYLFKKFENEVPPKKQLSNYLSRINGARHLRKFIRLNQLKHIVVPKKWLYPLPEQFSDPKTNENTYML